MTLHDELDRLADTAPRPSIDHDLWDRGRALRRRDRIVTSALVLALVVILGGLTSIVLGPPRAFSPADDVVPEGAIPSVIRDVPADAGLPLEEDLAIGRASAAFISSAGAPVVIGATDGEYHLLDLPLFSADSTTLALSPSGTRLAWMSAQGVGKQLSTPSLVVLDLTTGVIRAIRLERGAGLVPGPVAWSPDGDWLGWIGDVPGGGSAYGAVPVGPTTSTVGGLSRLELVAVAVAIDGTLAVGSQAQDVVVWPIDSVPVRLPRVAGTPGQFSPDGRLIAMVDPLIPTTTSSTLHVAKRKMWRHPFPADTFGASTIRPAGWLDDRLQLLLVQESFDDDAELVVTTPTVNATSTWRRGIGSIDPSITATLSLAVDLIPTSTARRTNSSRTTSASRTGRASATSPGSSGSAWRRRSLRSWACDGSGVAVPTCSDGRTDRTTRNSALSRLRERWTSSFGPFVREGLRGIAPPPTPRAGRPVHCSDGHHPVVKWIPNPPDQVLPPAEVGNQSLTSPETPSKIGA